MLRTWGAKWWWRSLCSPEVTEKGFVKCFALSNAMPKDPKAESGREQQSGASPRRGQLEEIMLLGLGAGSSLGSKHVNQKGVAKQMIPRYAMFSKIRGDTTVIISDLLLVWHPQWLSLLFLARSPAACTCSLGVPYPGAELRIGRYARDWFCMSPRQQQHLQINSIGERLSWVFSTCFSAWPKILLDRLVFARTARILSFEHVWHKMDEHDVFKIL